MSTGNKPKNLDFGAMEKKLREMGVSSNLEHLKSAKAESSRPESAPKTEVQVAKPQASHPVESRPVTTGSRA
ncbi:hypothetical protein JCM19235_2885 [Vibrio maritimus]|uniref:Uncharacterized protein n=1 Tax=Vibrio maritimus TaxID=990268 RepID=A0A090S3Q8_9VIBR|nr:hypothetical protein JCM19235_2885 [Vibrio maritimus]